MTDTPTTTGADAERREDDAALDLDAIETRARAATPGPWLYGPLESDNTWTIHLKPEGPGAAVIAQVFSEDDRDYIAGMDPQTTLALVALARGAVVPTDPATAISFVRDNVTVADTKCTEEHALKIIHGVLARVSADCRAGMLRAAEMIEADAVECERIGNERYSRGHTTYGLFAKANALRQQVCTIRAAADQQVPDLKTPYVARIVDLPEGDSELVLADELVVWDAPRQAWIEIAWNADRTERLGVRWPTRELTASQRDVRERSGAESNLNRHFEPSTLSVSDQIREHATEIYKHGSDYSRDALFNIAQQLETPSAPQPDAAPEPVDIEQIAEDTALAFAQAIGDPAGWQSCIIALKRTLAAPPAPVPPASGVTEAAQGFLEAYDAHDPNTIINRITALRTALAARGSRS